jgi:hypothetical protein
MGFHNLKILIRDSIQFDEDVIVEFINSGLVYNRILAQNNHENAPLWNHWHQPAIEGIQGKKYQNHYDLYQHGDRHHDTI